MQDILVEAEKLKQKNSWIREGLQNILNEIAKIDVDEQIFVPIMTENNMYTTYKLGIETGSMYVCRQIEGTVEDWSDHELFSRHADMQEVREFVENLPTALKSLKTEIRERQDFTIPESIKQFWTEDK